MEELFEQLDFELNPLYEKIIGDLGSNGYSIIDNFFDAYEVEQLRKTLVQKFEEDAFKKAAIGNFVNETIAKSIRGDFILWMDEQELSEAGKLFYSKINDLTTYLNKTCFMGILQKEFHYALYPPGTFYKRHIDTFVNDDRRKLSVVCYLNDESWQKENGGELVLYLQNKEGVEYEKSVLPLPGRMVIFKSQEIEHEVRPVISGKRLSITGWLKTR